MKGKRKKNDGTSLLKWIKIGTAIIGLILILLGFFLKNVNGFEENLAIPFKFFGVALITIIGLIYSVNAKENKLLKSLGILVLTAIVLTWLIPTGQFAQTQFIDGTLKRVGFTDLPMLLYYSLYFNIDKVIFLITLAAFYSLLAKTDAYKKIVNSIAKKFQGYDLIVALVTATIFVILSSIMTQTLLVFLFVPFAISILSKLKFDKVTAFAITIGAILIGMIGSPWGSEGLHWFGYYASVQFADGFWYRVIIQAVVYILYLLFIFVSLKKINKKDKNLELIEDPYEIEDTKAKTNTVPMIIILSLLAVITLLGYINWETNFGLKIFTNFHTWLTELAIGQDFTIFAYILGNSAAAFGSWEVITGISLLLIFYILIALVNKINFKEIVSSFEEGFKIIIKPVLFFVGTFLVFVVLYTSPYVATITNWAFSLTQEFNPFISSITAFVTSIFHTDLGYTGYIVGPYITSGYESSIGIVQSIYVATYGFAQLFVPTSGLLLLGLVYTKVDYKIWLKYIALFLVVLFIILLALFAIITYLI